VRMEALGYLIEEHHVHFIYFQEIIPNMYDLFRHSNMWAK
jgi:hypothetical protein